MGQGFFVLPLVCKNGASSAFIGNLDDLIVRGLRSYGDEATTDG